jgi:uncharacterized membrane protein
MRKNKLFLSAILTALAVAVGYAFLTIPNVEFLTATLFISGFILGPAHGAAVGLLAEFIFSLFNPLGTAAPPVLAAQVISMGIVGCAGGLVRGLTLSGAMQCVIFAAIGFSLTLLFDALTTLSFALFVSGLNATKILASFIYGMAFYIVHLGINTLIFASVVPLVLSRLHHFTGTTGR